MNNYKQATNQIMEYLEENQYCHTLISVNRMCFSRLEYYLSTQKMSYTPQAAEQWYESIKEELSIQQKSFYRMSLLRLQDVFESGEIHPDHETKHLKAYSVLYDGLKKELDEFLQSLATNHTPDTIRGYKHPCARFLIYFQKKGIKNLCEITYEMIISFYVEDIHQGKADTPPETPLFYTVIHEKMNHMSERNIERIVKKYADLVRKENPDIPDSVYPHMLRRSRASGLYRDGVPLEMISAILGHSSSETTKIYAIPSVEQLREALQKEQPEAKEPEKLWQDKEAEMRKMFGLN